MSYENYLDTMVQLSSQKRARIVHQGSVIFIESSPKNKWKVSSKLFNYQGLPRGLKETFVGSKVMRWKERGAYLQLDPNDSSIYLIEEMEASAKYVPFKYRINDFVAVAEEWKEVFEEFSQKDHTSQRI